MPGVAVWSLVEVYQTTIGDNFGTLHRGLQGAFQMPPKGFISEPQRKLSIEIILPCRGQLANLPQALLKKPRHFSVNHRGLKITPYPDLRQGFLR